MYFQYGKYRHDPGEGTLRVMPLQTVFSNAGIVESVTQRWEWSGRLQASTPGGLTTKIKDLRASYGTQGQGAGLFEDDGTPTAHVWDFKKCSVRIKSVAFPAPTPAEYTTYVDYVIELEASVTPSEDTGGGSGDTTNFQESLTFSGGGMVYVYRIARTGKPQKQLVTEQDTYKATQDGEATYKGMWPLPPNPKWPAAWNRKESSVVYQPAQRSGVEGQEIIWTCKTSWHYVFESDSPLLGLPSTLG